MVERDHGSFPSFSYEFDSRYPLHYLYSDLQQKTARPNFGRAVSLFSTCFNPLVRRRTHPSGFA